MIQKRIQHITKYITSTSKRGYIDKLDDSVNEQNNTYQRTIKMRPYIDFGKENDEKNAKFKIDDN